MNSNQEKQNLINKIDDAVADYQYSIHKYKQISEASKNPEYVIAAKKAVILRFDNLLELHEKLKSMV